MEMADVIFDLQLRQRKSYMDNPPHLVSLWFGQDFVNDGYVCSCDFHGISLKSLSNLFVFFSKHTTVASGEKSCYQVQKQKVEMMSSSRDEFKSLLRYTVDVEEQQRFIDNSPKVQVWDTLNLLVCNVKPCYGTLYFRSNISFDNFSSRLLCRLHQIASEPKCCIIIFVFIHLIRKILNIGSDSQPSLKLAAPYTIYTFKYMRKNNFKNFN